MPNQDTFTPSEAILLNGFLFAESCDPLHAFPLPLHGEQRFADEKELAIKMITAAFFANIETGFLGVRQAEHKSVLQDDPFMVSFKRQADWPKDTLENKLFLSFKSRAGSEITLYQVFNNIYPRPVYDSPWRDIDWDVCNGLYQRDLLKAETIELSEWAKSKAPGNRFRVGKYTPLEGFSYLEETRQYVVKVQQMLSRAEVNSHALWSAVQARIAQPKLIK